MPGVPEIKTTISGLGSVNFLCQQLVIAAHISRRPSGLVLKRARIAIELHGYGMVRVRSFLFACTSRVYIKELDSTKHARVGRFYGKSMYYMHQPAAFRSLHHQYGGLFEPYVFCGRC